MSEDGSRLRSARWFGGHDLAGFIHRSSLHAEGISRSALAGRPVTGGPLEPAWFRGRQLRGGTDLWHYADALRALAGEPAETEPLGLLSGWVGGW